MQKDETNTPFIFYLSLEDSLPRAFYAFDRLLKEQGFILVPVKIDQLQMLVASSEQEQVIVLCSVTDSREFKIYNEKVRGFLKFILKSKRLTFMHLSSFATLNDQRHYHLQKNYFFLRYPLNAKTLSANIMKYHSLKKRTANNLARWSEVNPVWSRMKSRNGEQTQRVLMLLKIDANNVFNRIKTRKNEYLEIFALRRTREHFPMIFNNRYEATTLETLASCSTELITALDQFYTPVEEMKWYLYQTEDMPNTVEDFISRKISRMGKLLTTLNMYLDAELGIEPDAPSVLDKPLFIDQPETSTSYEGFEGDFPISAEDDTSQKT